MIKMAHTVPPEHFHLQEKVSQCYLVLAHELTKNEKYKRAIMDRDRSKPMMLDNGGYELGEAISDHLLYVLAREFEPDILILPDVFLDGKTTTTRVEKCLDFLKGVGGAGDVKLMAVPQGKTVAEYMECLMRFYNMDEVDMLGISFLVVERCFSQVTLQPGVEVNRPYLIKLMLRLGLTEKPVHLLGLGDPIELKSYKNIPFVVSCDSSICYQAMLENCEIGLQGFKRRKFRKLNFKNVPDLSEHQKEMFLKNAIAVNTLAGVGYLGNTLGR